jgi:hypothetical protein
MTLDELTDREKIRETIARYSLAGDARDVDAFMALFADHAVLEFEGFAPLDGFRFEGIDKIDPTSRWQLQAQRAQSLGGSKFVRHNLTTQRIDLTGRNTANARTYFVVFTDIGPDHSGLYTDSLMKRDGCWLFVHRTIRLDWRSPESLFPAHEKRVKV